MTKQWKQSKGLTIIYVGDGKGKTTAAVGAAVRALGHGWEVLFMQFMKEEKWPSGERDLFRMIEIGGGSADSKNSRTPSHPSSLRSSSQRDASLLPHSLVRPRSDTLPARAPTPFGGIVAEYDGVDAEDPMRLSLGAIHVEVVGEGFVGIMGDKKERETHKNAARMGLLRASELLLSGKYRLVILDEILSAVDEGLLSEQQILDLMAKKPEDVTLIMTGHKNYPNIFAKTDLVTEMKKVKHPFDEGFIAKKGVDY